MSLTKVCFGLLFTLALLGCGGAKGEKKTQLKGKVTFKGQPVPAGYITFQSDRGGVQAVRIKDGLYDTSKEQNPGVFSGPAKIRITGFDGKKIPYYHDGKQIFNLYELNDTLPTTDGTKDFEVPASAANNLKIEPTADIP